MPGYGGGALPLPPRACLPNRLTLGTVQAAHLDAALAAESPKGHQDATGQSPPWFQ